MSDARLRFSPSILRRLGEELHPNPDQGLLELVRNAYDADASNCVIELINTHECGGVVRINDDGIGMDQNAIERGWLVLGRSPKTISQSTPKFGRIPAGNKGLGRLAALRMGAKASLITRPESDPDNEFRIDIDWREFDKYDVIEDVILEIKSGKRPQARKSGTEVSITNLRSRISRMEVKRLARGLLLLADPFYDDPSAFRPILKSPEFNDLEKLVQRRYFDDAEYHLVAELDEQGKARASVIDWKGNTLYAADHSDLRRKDHKKNYTCPTAIFDLWVFILDSTLFAQRITTISEVREWLGEFGGVHLYINGLRISPYGNPGNDWLDMNLSRVKSPELRPGTNTSVGRVAVTDLNEDLQQKTDRSGLIEGESFLDLKRFATDALDWMARRRLEEREKLRVTEREKAPRKVMTSKVEVEQAISTLAPGDQQKIRATFDKYHHATEREARTLSKEVQLYRTISTAGITAAVFAHESKKPLELISQDAKLVEKRGYEYLGDNYPQALGRQIGRIIRQTDALKSFGNLTLSLIDHEKRRTSRVEVHSVVGNVLDMFTLLITNRQVDVIREFDHGSPFLRASEAAIESILTNLLANSLKAFEKGFPGERKIVIRTEIGDGRLTLRILDSGPGIQGIGVKEIWLPGETTYPNGTGLGLTIVRDTVRDLGGSVDAVKKGKLGGAEIIIQLPIIGA